jgi:hypothetical protein
MRAVPFTTWRFWCGDGRAEIVGDNWLKKAGSDSASRASFSEFNTGFDTLHQLTTDTGSYDDGGGGKLDARWTSSTTGRCNSHSTDMVGSIHTPDSRNSHIGKPDNQIQFQHPQFRLKLGRQNAARERKPIHLSPMQLREAFSCSFPLLVCCFARMKAPAKDLFSHAKNVRLPL